MAEWLYEAGIGEARAALVDGGRIVKARTELPGLRVGSIRRGRLRAESVVELDGGGEVLATGVGGLSQGAALTVEIIREVIPEPGRAKRAKAVRVPDTEPRDGPDLLARIAASGHSFSHLAAHQPDALEAAGWSEVLDEAMTGEIAFPGGALRLSPTPAMALFDVDGAGPAEPLALAAAQALCEAIVRHGIGGSIGIDFPTLAGKAQRQAVDAAIDEHLAPPFERTAMNGFGFVQVIRPRHRPSLPETLRADPTSAAARAWLRQIERTPPPVPPVHRLTAPLARRLAAEPEWLAELRRRTGVDIVVEPV